MADRYNTDFLFEQACQLARDRKRTKRIGNEKRGWIEVDTAGLYYDTCARIPCDEYIVLLKYIDDSYEYYDGYHDRFCEYVPGNRLKIDEEAEAPIFSANLRHIMADRDLDLETLARISVIPSYTLHRYLNAKAIPNRLHLSKICRALGCCISDLTLEH